jgi:hypothetical protein
MVVGSSWGLPPLESHVPWTVQTEIVEESNPAAVGGLVVSSARFVGGQKESEEKGTVAGEHAAAGSSAAPPSCGAEEVEAVSVEEDAEDILVVGP